MQRDCFQMNHEDQRLNYPSNKPKAMVDRQDLPHWSSSLLLHDHLDDDYNTLKLKYLNCCLCQLLSVVRLDWRNDVL